MHRTKLIFDKSSPSNLSRFALNVFLLSSIVLSVLLVSPGKGDSDIYYTIEWISFSLVPLISLIFNRNIIRAFAAFWCNITFHESIWLIEGGFKYAQLLGLDKIVISFIALPAIFIPWYFSRYNKRISSIVIVLVSYSTFMFIWNLYGLPDVIFTPAHWLIAARLQMCSWLVTSIVFALLEIREWHQKK